MYIKSRINEILNKETYEDKNGRTTYAEEKSMIRVIMNSCDIPEHYYNTILFHKRSIDELYSYQSSTWKEYNILVSVMYVCNEYVHKDARLNVECIDEYIDKSFKRTKTVKDAVYKMYIIYKNEILSYGTPEHY